MPSDVSGAMSSSAAKVTTTLPGPIVD